MISLVFGGSGSGKSEFAENLVLSSGLEKRFYIATMKFFGDDGKKRVEKHRNLRKNKNFITIEETMQSGNLEDAVEKIKKILSAEKSPLKRKSAVLLECLSNLLADEMFLPDGKILSADEAFSKVAGGLSSLFFAGDFIPEIVVVSNNIFDDGLGYDETTKSYMRALAKINSFAAENAGSVYEVVAGIALKIK